jgi:hypothetical protein
MVNVKDGLAQLMDTEGCLGCCIVDSNSGMILGAAGGGAVNIELAAAGNTEVLRAERKTIKLLGLGDAIEDILITMGRQYHVFRPLAKNDALFVYVVLDKAKANLAMARHRVGAVEKELTIA